MFIRAPESFLYKKGQFIENKTCAAGVGFFGACIEHCRLVYQNVEVNFQPCWGQTLQLIAVPAMPGITFAPEKSALCRHYERMAAEPLHSRVFGYKGPTIKADEDSKTH
ncbi:hypothetical protein RAM80_20450 [Pseudomonas sp. App30]|uniref:hypothetical protein n=1 Tax=Pseudomonas sp. App30 TaxID=3068990 RepID=UPI003A810FA4